jgi:hypothetical protein
MTGLVRKATLLCACGLLCAGAAMASIPSAALSDLPDCDPGAPEFACVKVVGEGAPGPLGVSGANVPDPVGQFSVTVRDLGGNLMSGLTVSIDFTLCSDTKLCTTADGFLGQDVDCLNNRVTNTTDGSGVALFNIVGAANNTGDSPGADFACAEVFAGGVSLGFLTVVVADQDGRLGGGSLGMNVVDVSLMLVDLNSGNYYGRSDWEPTGPPLTVVDVSQALVVLNNGDSAIGCSSFCP